MDPFEILDDPTTLGMDVGRVAAICELTNRLKEWLDTKGFNGKVARWYVLLPVAVGVGFFVIASGLETSPAVIKEGLKYGIYSAYAWNFHRVAVKNQGTSAQKG
jgi:hypothetical protein